jgi:hypothetical protein
LDLESYSDISSEAPIEVATDQSENADSNKSENWIKPCPSKLTDFVNLCNSKQDCWRKVGKLKLDPDSCFNHRDDEGVSSWIAVNLPRDKKGKGSLITFRDTNPQRFNVFPNMHINDFERDPWIRDANGKKLFRDKDEQKVGVDWESRGALHRFDPDARIVDEDLSSDGIGNRTEYLILNGQQEEIKNNEKRIERLCEESWNRHNC